MGLESILIAGTPPRASAWGTEIAVVQSESRRDGAKSPAPPQVAVGTVQNGAHIREQFCSLCFQHERPPPSHPGSPHRRTSCLPGRHCPRRGFRTDRRRRNGQSPSSALRVAGVNILGPSSSETQGKLLPVDGAWIFLAGGIRRVQRESLAGSGGEEIH